MSHQIQSGKRVRAIHADAFLPHLQCSVFASHGAIVQATPRRSFHRRRAGRLEPAASPC